MRVLDLFSGTGSIKNVATSLGMEVVSLDINEKLRKPDLMVDIMKWDYTTYRPGHFDIIFAGVPCTAYSALQVVNKSPERRQKDIEESNKIVKRTLKIIEYFKPTTWFLENPASGSLKDQKFMKKLPYYIVSYCKYGFSYRKNTQIWTNLEGFDAKRCRRDCDSLDPGGRKHISAIGVRSDTPQSRTSSLAQKFAYPPKLIHELLNKINRI